MVCLLKVCFKFGMRRLRWRRAKIYSHKFLFLKSKGGIVKAHRRSIRSWSELENNLLDNLAQHPTKLSHPILTKTMVVGIMWHIIRAGGCSQLFLPIVAKCQEVFLPHWELHQSSCSVIQMDMYRSNGPLWYLYTNMYSNMSTLIGNVNHICAVFADFWFNDCSIY